MDFNATLRQKLLDLQYMDSRRPLQQINLIKLLKRGSNLVDFTDTELEFGVVVAKSSPTQTLSNKLLNMIFV